MFIKLFNYHVSKLSRLRTHQLYLNNNTWLSSILHHIIILHNYHTSLVVLDKSLYSINFGIAYAFIHCTSISWFQGTFTSSFSFVIDTSTFTSNLCLCWFNSELNTDSIKMVWVEKYEGTNTYIGYWLSVYTEHRETIRVKVEVI